MRVLVIEDDGELAEAIAAGLRPEGMAVDTALDGDSGLEHAMVNDYDVIETGVTVQGGVHRHPFQAQPGGDCLGQLAVVFDHEYPHGVSR